MPDSLSFNYLAVLAATVSTFLLGGLWYSPALFGRAWLREMGFPPDSAPNAGGTARIMGASFGLELIMAINLAAFIGTKASLGFGVLAGAAAGFGWVGAALGVTYLFERKSLRLFLINAGYHGVAFTLMGAILGAWR